MNNENQNEKWKINSIIKASAILKQFNDKQPKWTLTQLASAMKFPKSSIFNMLRTLEYCNIIDKEEEIGLYRLGVGILEMGYIARKGLPIIEFSLRHLEELHNKTGEIVYFTIPRHGKVLYLEAVYSTNRNVSYSITGKTLNMHCTGCGKAMLSGMTDEEIKTIINYHGMERFTETTITDFDELMKDIVATRKRGYAIDNSEEAHGVRCVAVPIMNGDKVLGSISVSGSIMSMTDEKIVEYAMLAMNTARMIADKAELFPRCKYLPELEK